MKTPVIVCAAAAAALVALAAPGPRPALACTGDPVEALVGAPVVFEGRVRSVVLRPDLPSEGGTRPHEITFEVIRSFRGAAPGDTVTAIGQVPIPGIPVMCAQFPQDLAGQFVVAGLHVAEGGGWLASAWTTPFLGPALAGSQYEYAVELVEIVTGSNPTRPALTIEPASPTCGHDLRFRGRQFPPGSYVLRYGSDQRVAGTPVVGLDGTFDVIWVVVGERCRVEMPPGWLLSFRALAISEGTGGPEPHLVAMTAGPLLGVVPREPSWADVTISPRPARCGEPVFLAGTGFEPNERLRVVVESTVFSRSSTLLAAGDGSFTSRVDVPAGRCFNSEYAALSVWVQQADFDLPPRLFPLVSTDVFMDPRSAAVGPPDAGTGKARDASGRDGRVEFILLLIGIAAGAALTARRQLPSRSRRDRGGG